VGVMMLMILSKIYGLESRMLCADRYCGVSHEDFDGSPHHPPGSGVAPTKRWAARMFGLRL
jgi:hypothetical protein